MPVSNYYSNNNNENIENIHNNCTIHLFTKCARILPCCLPPPAHSLVFLPMSFDAKYVCPTLNITVLCFYAAIYVSLLLPFARRAYIIHLLAALLGGHTFMDNRKVEKCHKFA